MSNLIERFFAVTRKAAYKIERSKGEISVEKTHMRAGAESKMQVGDKLQMMTYLAVTVKMGIFSYASFERPELIPAGIRNRFLAGTSEVVALFTHQETALECLRSNATDVKDPRWMAYTKVAIKAIGDDPEIKVSHHEETGFDEEFFN